MYIWNIKKELYHKGNPYDNIIKILKNNKNIIIEYKNYKINFTFTKYKNNGLKKYVELSTIDKNVDSYLHNLSIRIYDKNKNIYISNISKSDKISGKDFVKLGEEISKKIGGINVYLSDGTSIKCKNDDNLYDEVDLSLYLLFKNNKTYYQKLGYKLDIHSDFKNLPILPNKSAEKTMEYFLKKIKNLELSDIIKHNKIILNEIKKAIIKKTNIKIKTLIWDFEYINVNDKYELYNYFIKYSTLFNFLPKKGNFVKELLNLYNKNCNLYNYFINMLHQTIRIKPNAIGYIYDFKHKKYEINELYLFNMLIRYRNNIDWNGYFVKKL